MRSRRRENQRLEATRRRRLVLDAIALVDASPWLSGVEAFSREPMVQRDPAGPSTQAARSSSSIP